MMPDQRHLLILEGPAGGGKTTLANRLTEEGKCALIDLQAELGITLRRPRDYGRLDSPKLFAMSKDTIYYLAALSMFNRGYKTAIMDRGFFSNLVYSTIRNDKRRVVDTSILDSKSGLKQTSVEAEFGFVMTSIKSIRSHFDTMMTVYEVQPVPRITIEVCFVVPPVDELLRRRQNSEASRLYPFDAQQEFDLYNKIADIAIAEYPQEIGGIRCSKYI